MASSSSSTPDSTHHRPVQSPSTLVTWLLLSITFLAVYAGSLFTPPLLDDVDAAHAQAAQHIAESGDWITCQDQRHSLYRKAAAALLARRRALSRLGENTFATHLPNALAMLASPGFPGSGPAAPGARALASMPARPCSPPSARFCLPASSFPSPASRSSC